MSLATLLFVTSEALPEHRPLRNIAPVMGMGANGGSRMICEICRVRQSTVNATHSCKRQAAHARICPWCAQRIQPERSSRAGEGNGSQPTEETEGRLNIFSRLGDEALQVLDSAAERAHDAHQSVMTPEMLLAAILTDETLRDWVAESLGIDTEAVLAKLTLPEPREGHGLVESISFGPRLKHVLQLAQKTAVAEGADTITVAHLLAGVLADAKSLAAQVLDAAMGSAPDTLATSGDA
jgi:hypothetical protein